ncbi:MAG: DUF4145 domain-containing protein [Desulfomonilaceae bacterium]
MKTESNKTKDQKIKVYCSQCTGETNHVVMQSVDWHASEVIGYHRGDSLTVEWSNNYQIIQCQGCDSITFRRVSWNSEAQCQIGPNEWYDGTSEWLYPERSQETRVIRSYHNVPNPLARIYRETIECFNKEIFTLSAAGLRAIIEGICADQKIADGPITVKKADGSIKTVRRRNLEGKIAGLGEKGILTQESATILHEHRFLGNQAVHELNQPSPDELILAIDIIEHTLDALYEMPDKADELRRIKAMRLRNQNK